jgi:diguanylate cyclase (GGDEF)-like protein
MKILLVEDSATLRHAMTQYIIEAGHTPVIAKTGEEALQLLEGTPVDMIIMDVQLPGLNGLETTRLVREWLGDHWIPIIFVTGKSDDESYSEGIEAGGDDYLIKPVSKMIIHAKIRAMERIADMRNQLNQLNVELEALSQLDSLTQVLNRRTFNEQAEHQWLSAVRHQTPICVLMIDVDHFKLFNDHYGHPAGDTCLKEVTQTIKTCLHRPFDLLGRYGGEEFIALLPEVDLAGAAKVAENINETIRNLAIRHDASPVNKVVTVSIGGAVCFHTTGHDLEEVIKQADRALYKAKRNGRDRAITEEVSIHKTLLIADSDPERLQQSVATVHQHCNILTSDNADECLAIALDVCPDLILLDEATAEQSQSYLLQQLARSSKTAGIPILLIVDELDRERPFFDTSHGIHACLEEPFSSNCLLAKIQTLLG